MSSYFPTEAGVLDYVPLEQELTFSSTELMQCVNISIRVDGIVERDEIVTVSLTSSDAAVPSNEISATITIVDSDECKLTQIIR